MSSVNKKMYEEAPKMYNSSGHDYKKKGTLSICYIVKNESKTIRKSLESIKDIADEIVIMIDMDSSDDTREICYNFTSKVFMYDWINDFSHKRNYAISLCNCDWILILDGDEAFYEHEGLNKLITDEEVDAWELQQIHITTGQMCGQIRLFRNNKGMFFEGKIHETLNVNNCNAAKSDVEIVHFSKNRVGNENEEHLQNIIDGMVNEPILKQLYYKGIYYIRSGEPKKAFDNLNLCIRKLNPALRAFVHLVIASLYMDIAEAYRKECLTQILKSFEFAPNQNMGHVKLSEYYKLIGMPDKASEQIEKLKSRNQKLTDLQNDIFFNEEKIGELENVIISHS